METPESSLQSSALENTSDHEQAAAPVPNPALEQEIEIMERTTKRRKVGMTLHLCCASLWTIMVSLSLNSHLGKYGPYILGSYFAVWMMILGVFVWSLISEQRKARQITKVEDIRVIGSLVDVFAMKDVKTVRAAQSMLIRLLPRLQASDAPLLNRKQRAILCKTLTKTNSLALTLAILKGLEQVGDSHAISAVQTLAKGEGRMGKHPAVREAALRCLEFLTERSAKERDVQTLLRATTPSATPENVLLRPATAANSTDPTQLLRACAENGGPLEDTETELILALLQNMETVGDWRALPYIEQIAFAPTAPPAVREAAQRCLLNIRSRITPLSTETAQHLRN